MADELARLRDENDQLRGQVKWWVERCDSLEQKWAVSHEAALAEVDRLRALADRTPEQCDEVLRLRAEVARALAEVDHALAVAGVEPVGCDPADLYARARLLTHYVTRVRGVEGAETPKGGSHDDV